MFLSLAADASSNVENWGSASVLDFQIYSDMFFLSLHWPWSQDGDCLDTKMVPLYSLVSIPHENNSGTVIGFWCGRQMNVPWDSCRGERKPESANWKFTACYIYSDCIIYWILNRPILTGAISCTMRAPKWLTSSTLGQLESIQRVLWMIISAWYASITYHSYLWELIELNCL